MEYKDKVKLVLIRQDYDENGNKVDNFNVTLKNKNLLVQMDGVKFVNVPNILDLIDIKIRDNNDDDDAVGLEVSNISYNPRQKSIDYSLVDVNNKITAVWITVYGKEDSYPFILKFGKKYIISYKD